MPDIDLDFCSARRDEVRDELKKRYAEFGTAVAATSVTNSLKGAVRMAARALGHTPSEINALSRHVPARFRDRDRVYAGLDGWREALREPAMRGHALQDTESYGLLLELSAKLDGRIREVGTHLGGMVIGNHQYHLSDLVLRSNRPARMACSERSTTRTGSNTLVSRSSISSVLGCTRLWPKPESWPP